METFFRADDATAAFLAERACNSWLRLMPPPDRTTSSADARPRNRVVPEACEGCARNGPEARAAGTGFGREAGMFKGKPVRGYFRGRVPFKGKPIGDHDLVYVMRHGRHDSGAQAGGPRRDSWCRPPLRGVA